MLKNIKECKLAAKRIGVSMYLLLFACLSSNLIADTVTNPITGRTWMDKNLGANQVATSVTDPNAYGDLYQWGRLNDGHQSRSSSTTNSTSNSDTPGHSLFILADPDWRSPANDDLWQGLDGVNNPCPQGFRLPTEVEFEAERLTWDSNDAQGAFNSPLKFTLTGARSRVSGQIGNVGMFAGYRTSTLSDGSARVMGISSTNAFMGTRERADGNCVRCIMNEVNLGDLNGDDSIDILDIVLIVNLILEYEYDIIADMNQDSSLNVLDVVALVQVILDNY